MFRAVMVVTLSEAITRRHLSRRVTHPTAAIQKHFKMRHLVATPEGFHLYAILCPSSPGAATFVPFVFHPPDMIHFDILYFQSSPRPISDPLFLYSYHRPSLLYLYIRPCSSWYVSLVR